MEDFLEISVTIREFLQELASKTSSDDEENAIMQKILRNLLGWEKAVVTLGIVYLEGEGTIEFPPQSINVVAAAILMQADLDESGVDTNKVVNDINEQKEAKFGSAAAMLCFHYVLKEHILPEDAIFKINKQTEEETIEELKRTGLYNTFVKRQQMKYKDPFKKSDD